MIISGMVEKGLIQKLAMLALSGVHKMRGDLCIYTKIAFISNFVIP